MNEFSEREHILLTRGDAAIASLRAVLSVIAPMLQTNETAQVELARIDSTQPKTDKPTLLNVVLQMVSANVVSLKDVVSMTENTIAEINAFTELSGMDVSVDNAVDNVISAIRKSSAFYRKMSDDEIREKFGL